MTDTTTTSAVVPEQRNAAPTLRQQSVTTAAARQLATTTKSVPQNVGNSPRWLTSLLPWIALDAGTFRVNRRKIVSPTAQRVHASVNGKSSTVPPGELSAVPLFRHLPDDVLTAIAGQLQIERHAV